MENKEIIMYESKDGKLNIDVNLKDETVWLTQKQMGILFDRDYKTISKHIINIFNEGELERNLTVANFAIVQNEGEREVIRELNTITLM